MDARILHQIKSDVCLLQGLTIQNVADISELSWNFISRGLNRNVYKTVAQTLKLEPSAVQDVVSGIALLLIAVSKNEVTEEQFLDQAQILGLPSPTLLVIYENYRNHQQALSEALRGSELDSAQYRGLQWRLESQLASRSLRGGLQPRVVLKLDLARRGVEESIALVSDIPNIIHWSQMVEQALAESKTHNARKIQRAVM